MASPAREHDLVHPVVARLGAYAWRLIAIGVVVVYGLRLLGQLAVVLGALVIALFLARVLVPPTDWLRARGLRPALASAVALIGFLVTIGSVLAFIGIAVVNASEDIGPTVSEAIDDIERWVVEDSPFPVDRHDVERFRQEVTSTLGDTGASGLVSGATKAFEGVVALILGLVLAFFANKDLRRFARWVVGLLPSERRPVARTMLQQAWNTLGGYLMGAAALGAVEGVVIGVTLTVVGAELAVPMGALTFLAAFVPFAGAIVAGVLATLVALATAGLPAAVAVAAVALIVQQLDGDLLAPLIYGRALALHPALILVAITSGTALFGLAGSFLAVPVVAVVVNATTAAREAGAQATGGDTG